jgi:hypothetical protein
VVKRQQQEEPALHVVIRQRAAPQCRARRRLIDDDRATQRAASFIQQQQRRRKAHLATQRQPCCLASRRLDGARLVAFEDYRPKRRIGRLDTKTPLPRNRSLAAHSIWGGQPCDRARTEIFLNQRRIDFSHLSSSLRLDESG